MPRPDPGAFLGEFTQILYRVDEADGIAFVSMNRPKARNAFSRIMTAEIDAAFKHACEDPRVKVIILRGEGGHFSSGHDLGTAEQTADTRALVKKTLAAKMGEGEAEKAVAAAPQDQRSLMDLGGPRMRYERWSDYDVEMCLGWRQLSKPLLGGIKGFCIYHGWAVAASCDILLCAEDAKIMPGLVEHNTLPFDLALNSRKAKEVLMQQRFVLPDEAEELGMVNRVVATEDLDAELVQMAKVIAKADPFHLRMMKLTVNQAQDAAGMSSSMRSALSAWSASVWSDGAAGVGPGAPKVFAPIAHGQSSEVMYYAETAAVRAAPKRRGPSKL